MNYLEIIIFILFTISVLSFLSIAPWVPTRNNDLDRINKIIQLKKWEKFLEMWCWNAKVSLYIAKNNPDCSIIGIELSPLFYLISKIRVLISWWDNIQIIYWNALKYNLSQFDIIYVFGLPETVSQKIFPKLSQINNINFRFISYCFKMTNSQFIETRHKIENRFAIYEYSIVAIKGDI